MYVVGKAVTEDLMSKQRWFCSVYMVIVTARVCFQVLDLFH